MQRSLAAVADTTQPPSWMLRGWQRVGWGNDDVEAMSAPFHKPLRPLFIKNAVKSVNELRWLVDSHFARRGVWGSDSSLGSTWGTCVRRTPLSRPGSLGVKTFFGYYCGPLVITERQNHSLIFWGAWVSGEPPGSNHIGGRTSLIVPPWGLRVRRTPSTSWESLRSDSSLGFTWRGAWG